MFVVAFLVTAAAAVLLSGAGFSPLTSSPARPPSDAALEDTFRRHEAEFRRLVEMSHADPKVVRIAHDFTWLDDSARWPRPESELGFSRERRDEYRRLFERLGLKGGLTRNSDGSIIYLSAYNEGLLTAGAGKGYVYSTSRPSPVHDSLDDLSPTALGGKYAYKSLKATGISSTTATEVARAAIKAAGELGVHRVAGSPLRLRRPRGRYIIRASADGYLPPDLEVVLRPRDEAPNGEFITINLQPLPPSPTPTLAPPPASPSTSPFLTMVPLQRLL